jgi:hypothetical protein
LTFDFRMRIKAYGAGYKWMQDDGATKIIGVDT